MLLERNEDKDKYHLRCHMLDGIHGIRAELSPVIRLKETLLRHSAADKGVLCAFDYDIYSMPVLSLYLCQSMYVCMHVHVFVHVCVCGVNYLRVLFTEITMKMH